MRSKSIFLLVIALAFGVVASVAVSQIVLDQKNRGAVETVPVLIVTKEISAATKIPADSVRVEQWPADRVPVGALVDPKMVENKFTKQRIYPGEPIIEAKLSTKGRDFIVPEGYRTFDIGVKDETGGGGYIGPGDHVDVFGYFDKGPRVKAAKSVKVMENLEVVMIDGNAIVDPEASKTKKSTTIQLLVKDSQYIVLDTASNLGKLRLALRPPNQAQVGQDQTDDGEKFINWLKESEAPTPESQPTERAVAQSPTVIPPVVEEKTLKHEMVIVTAGKTTLFRFGEGKGMPQKIDMDLPEPALGNPNAVTPVQSYNPQTSQGNKGSAPNRGGNSSFDSSTTKMEPVNPPNSVQNNLSWDPSSASWKSGGFKATYPSNE